MEKKKKATTKKAAVKKETVKTEVVRNSEVIVRNQVDYTLVLNRILYALVVIGVLLALNLCVNIVVNSNNSNNNKNNNSTNKGTEEVSADYDVSKFEELTATELDAKIKKGGTEVVYIGRPSCGWCVKYVPILTEVQGDLGFTTNYIDLEKVTSSDAEILMGYDSFVEENFGSTPMTLVFSDGSYVKGTAGYLEADDLKAFFKEAGIE